MSEMKKPGIILGPVREVSMFAIIKSFVSRGIDVIVFDPDPKAPGFSMSGIHEKLVSPDPEKKAEEFRGFLINIGKKYPGNILLVNDDLYTQLIAEYANELKNYLLFLISEPSVNVVGMDKAKTAEASAKYGLPFPRTYFFENPDDDLKVLDIDFPLILKPRKLAGSRGQYLIKNREDLVKSLNIVGNKKSDYIVQEWIPGDIKNLCTLGIIFDESHQLKAVFTARRLDTMHSKRVNQGITTYLVSEKISEIIESGINFLKNIKWRGIAELEFKFDERDSKFKLLEINPRVWSWIKLPMECGVDFPKIYYDLLCGKDFNPLFEFRTGVTYLRSITDTYSSFYRLLNGEINLNSIGNLFRKYTRVIFNPEDNLIDELPWVKPNLQWIHYYFRRFKEYG